MLDSFSVYFSYAIICKLYSFNIVSLLFSFVTVHVPVGFPLDPPLRSRFQARYIEDASDMAMQLHSMMPASRAVMSVVAAVQSGLKRLACSVDASVAASNAAASPARPSTANTSMHLLPVRYCHSTTQYIWFLSCMFLSCSDSLLQFIGFSFAGMCLSSVAAAIAVATWLFELLISCIVDVMLIWDAHQK